MLNQLVIAERIHKAEEYLKILEGMKQYSCELFLKDPEKNMEVQNDSCNWQ